MITWLDKIDGFDLGNPQKNVNAADMNQIKNNINVNETALDAKVTLASIVFGEVLSGTVNGVNTVFNLSFLPVVGTVQVYLGVRLRGGGADYSITGSQVTFVTPPIVGEVPVADYIKA